MMPLTILLLLVLDAAEIPKLTAELEGCRVLAETISRLQALSVQWDSITPERINHLWPSLLEPWDTTTQAVNGVVLGYRGRVTDGQLECGESFAFAAVEPGRPTALRSVQIVFSGNRARVLEAATGLAAVVGLPLIASDVDVLKRQLELQKFKRWPDNLRQPGVVVMLNVRLVRGKVWLLDLMFTRAKDPPLDGH